MRGRTETGRTGRQSEQAHWNPGKRRTGWYVWYVWYGMVRYPYDSTCTECREQTKSHNRTDHSASAIFGSYSGSTRGHLDTHSVSPRLWEGLPFREDFGHGKPPRLQPAYSYPCIPAGNIYFRYIPRIHYCEVHRNTQTGNSPRWLPVFGPVDADWSQAEALARPHNFPILTVPYRNWSEVPRALALLLFFLFASHLNTPYARRDSWVESL